GRRSLPRWTTCWGTPGRSMRGRRGMASVRCGGPAMVGAARGRPYRCSPNHAVRKSTLTPVLDPCSAGPASRVVDLVAEVPNLVRAAAGLVAGVGEFRGGVADLVAGATAEYSARMSGF